MKHSHESGGEFSEGSILDMLHRFFKRVSKSWHDYISGSESITYDNCRSRRWKTSPPVIGFFYQEKPLNYPAHKGGFVFTSREGSDERNLVDGVSLNECFGFLDQKNAYIVASSEGFLLCCKCPQIPMNYGGLFDHQREYPMEYYVYSPCTKQWLALPKPQHCYENVGVGFLCKIDDPGSDLISYTIVRYGLPEYSFCWEEQSSVKIERFSSETSVWTTTDIQLDVPHCLYPVDNPALVVDGSVFFWLDRGPQIFAVDVLGRRTWLLDLPHSDIRCFSFYYIYASNGCLYYVSDDAGFTRIWTLESNFRCPNAKWLLKYQGHFPDLINKFPEIFGPADSVRVEPLGLHPDYPQFVYYHCLDGKTISHDMDNETVELVNTFTPTFSSRKRYKYFPYAWNERARLLPPLKLV